MSNQPSYLDSRMDSRRYAVVVIAFVCLTSMVAAQSTAPVASPPGKPHVKVDPDTGLPPGMPDFRGIYTNRWIVNMADGRFVEKTVAVPFTEKGKQIYAERTENFQKDDPNLHCLPSGLPRAGGTPYPLKIMQAPDESAGTLRDRLATAGELATA